MSLINEALKKAQRQRTEGPSEPAAAAGSGRIVKRSQPRSASSMFLLATAAVVLVLLSVGVTVYFVNRPAAKPPIAAVNLPPVTVPPKDTPTEPGANSPVITPIVVPPPVAENPVASEPVMSAPPVRSAPEISPAVSAAAKPTQGTAPRDERIQAYVDALRISAFKPAGEDSRVRMNDRNFRLNDIVDRTLGVRIVKVEADSITFADANGVTYVKYF